MIDRLAERRAPWDMVVVGGGATGAGIAVDAASRGYDVALIERHDFGKGTSSRSTKLVHGGVRYLEQGNISLVMEALKERGILRQNAPHLVSNLAFVVPNYDWWEAPFYGLGLKVYNVLAGKYGFGSSEILSREETLQRLPTIKTEGLRGGVVYYDGQFDDSRLLVNLVQTAVEQGGVLANYVSAIGVTKGGDGFVDGVVARDEETGREFHVGGRVVINATGPFADGVRRLAERDAPPLIAPSQGIHLVFPQAFLPSDNAIMVPHTRDGRVMFAIPWHGHTLVGTTDTPIDAPTLEPAPLDEEVAFILETASLYLRKAPTRDDVLSVFVGIRPLVKSGDSRLTAALSRDHTIHIDASGLLTTTGGKWTTYRHMAEDTVNQAADLARLAERPCVTKSLNVHGFHQPMERFGALAVYGADAPAIQDLARAEPRLGERLDDALPYIGAEVVWAVRKEMARTVEDVLARRTRALFLNAQAAIRMAPAVASLMAKYLGKGKDWQRDQVAAFTTLATGYSVSFGLDSTFADGLPPARTPATNRRGRT
jgi:glycerol-3-phosphate dehydrogenase